MTQSFQSLSCILSVAMMMSWMELSQRVLLPKPRPTAVTDAGGFMCGLALAVPPTLLARAE